MINVNGEAKNDPVDRKIYDVIFLRVEDDTTGVTRR
jgi:hypothetical protein